jgi:hypothetical protein
VSGEEFLLDMVTTWAARAFPHDIDTSRVAAAVAVSVYAAGASASEACCQARRVVACRATHPSQRDIPILHERMPS